jgi:hypothetical protein
MKRLLILLTLSLLWVAPAAAGLPADQIFEEKSVRISWDADGKQTMRVRTVRRLLTDYAVRRLSDPRIRHDEDRQDLTILAHEVRTPDGATIVAPDYARNISQADGLGQTTDFASVVELVATQVGAQRGAVLTLEYEVTDREAFRPAMDITLALGETDPVVALLVEVDVPDESPFHWAISHDTERFQVYEAPVLGGNRSIRISGANLPAYPAEAGGISTTPRLLTSTWTDWNSALQYFEGTVRDAWSARTTCDLHAARAAAVPRHGNLAALHLARNGLRIIHGDIPGREHRPRSVCRTWESGYATPLEAGLVLAALAGDEPRAGVVVSTGNAALIDAVPGLAQWVDVRGWLGTWTGEEPYSWLPASDTVQEAPPLLPLGAGSFGVTLHAPPSPGERRVRGNQVLRPIERPCWSLDEERTYRSLAGGGRALTLTVRLAGRPDVWITLTEARNLEATIAGRVTGLLPGGSLVSLAVTRLGPSALEFRAELEAPTGDDAPVPLGTLFRDPDALAGLVGLQERRLPLALPLCARVSQTLKAQGLVLAGLVPRETGPEPKDPRHPLFRSRWTTDHAFVRTLRGAQTLVSPEDWPIVRAELGAWLQDQGRLLLLLPSGEAATE